MVILSEKLRACFLLEEVVMMDRKVVTQTSMGTRMSAHACLFLLCFGMACCAKERNMQGSNIIIERCGIYELREKADKEYRSLRLSVWIEGVSIVEYEVSDNVKQSLIRSDAGGNFSRWYFYWDSEKGELWVYSGDIGIFVWRKDRDGNYKRELVENELVKEMPDLFYKHASRGQREEWERYR
jgi:hypothetical protein